MQEANHSEYTLAAINAAISAGNYLRQGFRTQMEVSNKEGRHNLVTEYDTNSEKKIISFIKDLYPDHDFIAEESGIIDSNQSNVKWIIDPLDGTVNFAHGIPFFAVSIAVECNKEVVSGVVFQPMTYELFVAERKKGAFFNGNRINVSENKNIDEAFLATGFPYNVAENPDHCIEKFMEVLKIGSPIRRLGVAALDLSYVAVGRFDAFFEVSLAPWDCAAAKLIVEESGGKVTSWNGSPFDIHSYKSILASNGHLHSDLTRILSRKI